MYPGYSWQQARSCCNNTVHFDESLDRPNPSMVECRPAGRRPEDFRSWEMKARPGSRGRGVKNVSSDAQMHDQILAAAATFVRSSSKAMPSNSSFNSLRSKQAPPSPSRKKASRKRSKLKSDQTNYSAYIAEKPEGSAIKKTSSTKHLKNKQNIQYQDSFSGRSDTPMEVINEEQEENDSEHGSSSGLDSAQSRRAEKSCADFLNIVHDTVLETIQSSVKAVMKDYFVKTIRKIESLCTQVTRADSVMNKMYAEIMEKITDQNEKHQHQFKGLCQYIADLKDSVEADRQSPLDLRSKNVCARRKSSCSHCGSELDSSAAGSQQRYHQEAQKSKEDCSKVNSTTSSGIIMTDASRTSQSVHRLNAHAAAEPPAPSPPVAAAERGSKISNIVEQLGANRVSRISNLIEQFGNLGARHPKLMEQIGNIGLKNINISEQLANIGVKGSNLTEPVGANLETGQINRSRDALSAILVEKLSNDRDIINSILAEKLKSTTTYTAHVAEEHHKYDHPAKQPAYHEDKRKFQNVLTGQRLKDREREELTIRRNYQDTARGPRSQFQIGQRNLTENRPTSVPEVRPSSQSEVRSSRVPLLSNFAESCQRSAAGSSFNEAPRRIIEGDQRTFSHAKSGPSLSDLTLDQLKL